MATDTRYNGWSNYETWNVALWIGNDEGLYRLARTYAHCGYWPFAKALCLDYDITTTLDGVSYLDPCLDQDELDSMMEGLLD